jgi:AcrR family transcriptional regulator
LKSESAFEKRLRLNATEEKIIASARHCFETIGVRKTRVEDIAVASKLTRQTIYKYFSSKQDMVDRIAHIEMKRINTLLRERLKTKKQFPDRLTEALVLSVEISRENPYIRRVIEDSELMPSDPSQNVDLYLWHRAQWQKMLERARDAGELAADVDIDSVVYWLILSQSLLMNAYEWLSVVNIDVRGFVRRFMVESLLSAHTPDAHADKVIAALREENNSLRALVSDQALEIFRLQRPADRQRSGQKSPQ